MMTVVDQAVLSICVSSNLWTGTVLVVITSRIWAISCSRLLMLSLYFLMAASVLLYSSCSTSFSEVTASSFSLSCRAVASNCSRRLTNSSSSSLFRMSVCCSISRCRFSSFRFSLRSLSCCSSRLHLALASLSARWVISSWFLSWRSMFSTASRWFLRVAYSFSSWLASLRSFWHSAWVLSWRVLALEILAANSLRIFLSCIQQNYHPTRSYNRSPMEQQQALALLDQRISQFLTLSAGNPTTQEIATATAGLTQLTSQPGFISLVLTFIGGATDKHRLTLATSLLKDKFKFDFETLTMQQLEEYFKQLVSLSHTLGTKSISVMSNLCLSIAYIYLNIAAVSPQPVQQFLAPFLPTAQSAAPLNYFFKVLEYLAGEIDSSRIVIDQQVRTKALSQLLSQQKQILLELNNIAPNAWDNPQIDRVNLVQCFTEWVLIHKDNQVLNSLPSHFLMQRVFAMVQECGEEVLYCVRKVIGQLGSPAQHGPIYAYLGSQMMNLLGNVEGFLKEMYIEQASDVLRIVIMFANKAVPIFLGQPDEQVRQFLTKLIEIMKQDLLQCFEELSDFWEKLVEQANGKLPPSLADLFQQSYSAYCMTCKYPLKLIKQLNTQSQARLGDISREGETIYGRREYLLSFAQKYAKLRGSDNFFQFVIERIKLIAHAEEKVLWPYLEVYLWSLVECTGEAQYSPAVEFVLAIYIQLLGKQNLSVPLIVKKTFLRIFRGLFKVKGRSNAFVENMFKLTVDCLGTPMLAPIAERTFNQGCRHNSQLMRSHTPEMLSLLNQHPNRQDIVCGVVYLICGKDDLCQQYLFEALNYVYETMLKMVQLEENLKKSFMYSIIGSVKVINQNGSQFSPVCKLQLVLFLRKIWPMITTTLQHPPDLKDDQSLQVQRLTKLLKATMRYLQFDFSEFIESLFSSVFAGFQHYPVCGYVYILEIAITVFYTDPRYTQYFKGIYLSFCESMGRHLSSLKRIEDYCYLVDDFLGMNKRLFIYNSSILLSSGQLPQLVELCLGMCFGSSIPRIAKSAYSFFEVVFMVYWRQEYVVEYNKQEDVEQFVVKAEDKPLYDQLRGFLNEKMQVIVGKMVLHLNESPAEMTRTYIKDTLEAQLKAFPAQNVALWGKILGELPPDILLASEKERFVGQLERMRQENGSVNPQVLTFLHKYLGLMDRRMMNAKRRKAGEHFV